MSMNVTRDVVSYVTSFVVFNATSPILHKLIM